MKPLRNKVYLDSNAGAPLHPRVVGALRDFFNCSANNNSFTGDQSEDRLIPGNPSSIHAHGQRAKSILAEARESVAASIHADPEQIVLTSSGTEANQMVVRGVLEKELIAGKTPHWILSPTEHDSVLKLKDWLESRGGEVSLLPLDESGRPKVSALGELWRENTVLVSVAWVNNETGVIADIPGFVAECDRLGGKLHIDAAQAWGKLPIRVENIGSHILCASAHKIGGLAGAGFAWLGRGVRLEAVTPGHQEKGRRGGTENLLGIHAMGVAAQEVDANAFCERVESTRDRIEKEVFERVPGAVVNGREAERVPNTLSLSFEGVGGDGLVMALDLAGYSVSAGSACASGVLEPSHVLKAMGRSDAEALASIRVSLWEALEADEVERFVATLERVVERVRGVPAPF